jgi:hypothetical protein
MSTHGGTSTSAPPATTVTGPGTIGHAAVVGTGLHYARNDHDHGLPILDYNSMQYNDLLGWTFDPQLVSLGNNGGLPQAAMVSVGRIPLPAAMTVTNVIADLVILGATLTHSFLALFKSDGTVIGQSADQSAAWGVGGAVQVYTLPLAGGPYVCTPLAANDFLYAAAYCGTAVTLPKFQIGYVGNLDFLTGPPRCRAGVITQADTGALTNINPANISNGYGVPMWFGIS